MNFWKKTRFDRPSGLPGSSGFVGLSSKRSGHQAFNLRMRVRIPLTLCFFVGAFILWCCSFPIIRDRLTGRTRRFERCDDGSNPSLGVNLAGKVKSYRSCCLNRLARAAFLGHHLLRPGHPEDLQLHGRLHLQNNLLRRFCRHGRLGNEAYL